MLCFCVWSEGKNPPTLVFPLNPGCFRTTHEIILPSLLFRTPALHRLNYHMVTTESTDKQARSPATGLMSWQWFPRANPVLNLPRISQGNVSMDWEFSSSLQWEMFPDHPLSGPGYSCKIMCILLATTRGKALSEQELFSCLFHRCVFKFPD